MSRREIRPRRDQAGNLVPWVADVMRGLAEVERLRASGMDLDYAADSELAELGASIPSPDPLDAVDLAELLEQIEERNRQTRARLAAGARPWRRGDPDPPGFDPSHGDPVRAKELELVHRHNLAVVNGDPRYLGLELDRLLGHGMPILHLDPEPELQDQDGCQDVVTGPASPAQSMGEGTHNPTAPDGTDAQSGQTSPEAERPNGPNISDIPDGQPDDDAQGDAASRAARKF